MNRLRLLFVMPWVASPLYTRLFAVLFVGVALLIAFALAVIGTEAHRIAFILILGFAIWALWSSYLATTLQLARNAKDLCLPRMQRDADLSLLVFTVLSLAVPTVLCWMLGTAPVLAAAVFIVAAALGLAYMLLPLWVGFPLVMAVFVGIMTFALHTATWACVSLALCCAGSLVLIMAVTLASLAGKPMHTLQYVLLYAVQLVLSMLVLIKAMPTDQYHGPHSELIGVVPAWLLVLWGLYLIVLAVLAIHAARELRKRPPCIFGQRAMNARKEIST